MLTPPIEVTEALKSGAFFYADLIEINFGDAFGTGDEIRYYTNAGHDIELDGHLYKASPVMKETAQISRKAGLGSDSFDVRLSGSDEQILAMVTSRQYMNKRSYIYRIILDDLGGVIGNYKIPVKSANGISHKIDTSSLEPEITMKFDTALNGYDSSAPFYCAPEYYENIFPGDKIMRGASDIRKVQGDDKGDEKGEVNAYTMNAVFGERDVECVHLGRFYHYIPLPGTPHSITFSYTTAGYTTFILGVSLGDVDGLDYQNITIGGQRLRLKKDPNSPVWNNDYWKAYFRDSSNNQQDMLDDPNMASFFQLMGAQEKKQFQGMRGQGMTILILQRVSIYRNRANVYPYQNAKVLVGTHVKGKRCEDPRTGTKGYSDNPAVQLFDYLQNKEYGSASLNVFPDKRTFAKAADYFDNVTFSIDGKNKLGRIKSNYIIDTSKSFEDIFDYYGKLGRLWFTDYSGKMQAIVEKVETPVMHFESDDLLEGVVLEGGELVDRANRFTLTISQKRDTGNGKVEYDKLDLMYPQNSPSGKAIYKQWLKEDGGRRLDEKESFKEITDVDQGMYHCAVSARLLRNIDECEIVVPPIAWLLELGDVITITDARSGQKKRPWRIEEIEEDDAQVTLKLINYDASAYSPDLTMVPLPDQPSDRPFEDVVGEVTGLTVTMRGDKGDDINDKYRQGYAFWTAPKEGNVDHYRVFILNITKDKADEFSVVTPKFTIEKLDSADQYEITVVAVSEQGSESKPVSKAFNIKLPPVPDTFAIEATPFSITIKPSFVKSPAAENQIRYKFYFSETNDEKTAKEFAFSSRATKDELQPDREYFFWVKTWTEWGESTGKAAVSARTMNLASAAKFTIKSDNGYKWLRDSRGHWNPNTRPKNLEVRFFGSNFDDKATAKFVLDPKTGNVTASATSTSKIDVVIEDNGTVAPSVKWTHKKTGATASRTIYAIVSGKDGETLSVVAEASHDTFIRLPNKGAWTPTTPATATFKFYLGKTLVKTASATVTRANDDGHLKVVTSKTNDIVWNVSGDMTTSARIIAIYDGVASATLSFASIEGGDRGPRGPNGKAGKDGVGKNGATGFRGTMDLIVSSTTPPTTATLWSKLVAAIPKGSNPMKPIPWDTVTFNHPKPAKGNYMTETWRFVTGGTAPGRWEKIVKVIDGSILVKGTVAGESLYAKSKIVIGSGNDIAVIDGTNDAANASRIWVGHTDDGQAGFAVSKRGELWARDGKISGKFIVGTNRTFKTIISGSGTKATDMVFGAGIMNPARPEVCRLRIDANGRMRAYAKNKTNPGALGPLMMDLDPETGLFKFKGDVYVKSLLGAVGTIVDIQHNSIAQWKATKKGDKNKQFVATITLAREDYDREISLEYNLNQVVTLQSPSAIAMDQRSSWAKSSGGLDPKGYMSFRIAGNENAKPGQPDYTADYTIYGGNRVGVDAVAFQASSNTTLFIPNGSMWARIVVPAERKKTPGPIKIRVPIELDIGLDSIYIPPSSGSGRYFKAVSSTVTATVSKRQDPNKFDISVI